MIRLQRSLVSIVVVAVVLSVSSDSTWAQETVFGFNAGMVPGMEEGVYLDDPIDSWVDREVGVILGGQYYRRLSPTFMVGGYGEYEALNAEGERGSRFGFGLTYVARYPGDLSSGLGFELGGKLGVTFATLGDFDSQFGADFGVFLGPVIQIAPNMQAAVHFGSLYGWYGGGDDPEGVQNARPALRVQVYSTF